MMGSNSVRGSVVSARWEGRVDPKEIFELIVKADEALKYATEEKA